MKSKTTPFGKRFSVLFGMILVSFLVTSSFVQNDVFAAPRHPNFPPGELGERCDELYHELMDMIENRINGIEWNWVFDKKTYWTQADEQEFWGEFNRMKAEYQSLGCHTYLTAPEPSKLDELNSQVGNTHGPITQGEVEPYRPPSLKDDAINPQTGPGIDLGDNPSGESNSNSQTTNESIVDPQTTTFSSNNNGKSNPMDSFLGGSANLPGDNGLPATTDVKTPTANDDKSEQRLSPYSPTGGCVDTDGPNCIPCDMGISSSYCIPANEWATDSDPWDKPESKSTTDPKTPPVSGQGKVNEAQLAETANEESTTDNTSTDTGESQQTSNTADENQDQNEDDVNIDVVKDPN